MKIDKYVNKALSSILGEDTVRKYELSFHSQNLNVNDHDEPIGLPYEGRCWLHIGHKRVKFCWSLWGKFCGASVGTDSEDSSLKLHAALPPISFWLSIPVTNGLMETKPFRTFDFEFAEVRVFDSAVWWKFWAGEDWNRHGRLSRYREGNLHVVDSIFGGRRCDTKVLETKDVSIPMPEGVYQAKARLEERTRYRKRWPVKEVSRSIWVDIPDGIPHQGKGENPWDCGEDGLYGCGVEGESYEKAIAHVVELVLRDRRRYDGDMNAKYQSPAERSAAIAKKRSSTEEAGDTAIAVDQCVAY